MLSAVDWSPLIEYSGTCIDSSFVGIGQKLVELQLCTYASQQMRCLRIQNVYFLPSTHDTTSFSLPAVTFLSLRADRDFDRSIWTVGCRDIGSLGTFRLPVLMFVQSCVLLFLILTLLSRSCQQRLIPCICVKLEPLIDRIGRLGAELLLFR